MTAPLYPESSAPEISMAAERSAGDDYNESIVKASVHTATHADAPYHFLDSPIDITKMPLRCYLGACFVLQTGAKRLMSTDLQGRVPTGCRRLLIKGGGECYLTAETAKYLHEWGVELVGTDAWSIGPLDNEAEVHRAFLRYPIAVLENLDLSEAEERWYFLSALPVKLDGCDGAFVRAVLAEDICLE